MSRIWLQIEADMQAGLMDVLPGMIDMYGSAAATLGSDWYDEMRDAAEVPGRFSAITAELPDAGRAQALAGWATATGTDAASVLTLVSGGLQKAIADIDRQSVRLSSVEDPKSQGWKRTGSGKCDFCRMLIGRGAVYSDATAHFESHDHCHCLAVPEFQ
jgi:hypothetical protein